MQRQGEEGPGTAPGGPRWIAVKVHPHAGKQVLVQTAPGRFEAWVKEKPIEGRANAAVIALLVRYLEVPAERRRMVKGRHGRQQVFRVIPSGAAV